MRIRLIQRPKASILLPVISNKLHKQKDFHLLGLLRFLPIIRKIINFLPNLGIVNHQFIFMLKPCGLWKIYETTFNREGFTPYPKQFILKEFQAFNIDQNSIFFLGKVPSKFAQEGLPIFQAGSLVLFTKSSGFYHQGASVHSPYPVTYDLQWHSILEAKRRGCRFYNFY